MKGHIFFNLVADSESEVVVQLVSKLPSQVKGNEMPNASIVLSIL